jgi:hypothetical protein
MNRASSVDIATGLTAGVRFAAGARDSSVLNSDQTGSGAHPESKAAQAWSYHLPPSSADVKNGRATPPYPIRLHGVMLN